MSLFKNPDKLDAFCQQMSTCQPLISQKLKKKHLHSKFRKFKRKFQNILKCHVNIVEDAKGQ
jgi:hypothetical protein